MNVPGVVTKRSALGHAVMPKVGEDKHFEVILTNLLRMVWRFFR
jgi:hypothetical protein